VSYKVSSESGAKRGLWPPRSPVSYGFYPDDWVEDRPPAKKLCVGANPFTFSRRPRYPSGELVSKGTRRFRLPQDGLN